MTYPFDPIFIEIGPIAVAWYAVFILIGISLGAYLALRESKNLHMDVNIMYDGILIGVPLAIVGVRLYYILFNLDQYDSIGQAFDITKGFQGLAIHGGIITTILFIIVYTRVRKVNMWLIYDIVAPSFLVGQIIGRWGNFMNQEAHGPATTYAFLRRTLRLPNFIVEQMNINGVYYHPTFLYEGLWNLVGLIAILIARRKKFLQAGDIIAFYLFWYGLGRGLIIEPMRMDPLMMFGLRANVINSLLLSAAGLGFIIYKRLKMKDLPYYHEVLAGTVSPLTEEKA